MTKKEKILACVKAIPTRNLMNFIKQGEVTLNELLSAGLPEEKADEIKEHFQDEDENLWQKAQQEATPESYSAYLQQSALHLHEAEARELLSQLDEQSWAQVQWQLNETSLQTYIDCFPEGNHAGEARGMLADLPWLHAKQTNTIAAYEQYMAEHPGKHDDEARRAILDIQDDNEWNNLIAAGISSDSCRNYLAYHPNGKHADEAYNYINGRAEAEGILNNLRSDPNAYSAQEIQNYVANNVITRQEIGQLFGDEKANAIMNFQNPAQLPSSQPPALLKAGSTEVYFWGTPGSGKTCALGTIISSANKKGIWSPQECKGQHYMDKLSNIFMDENICTLPESTIVSNIQEMATWLWDKPAVQHGKPHPLTLVDMAGELFRSVYVKQNMAIPLDPQKDKAVETALKYLKDGRNKKIHFFIVEYGAHLKTWEGLNMGNYLQQMIQYLRNNKVFSKSTVGVYVLVTKCDKMQCPPEERPKRANEYVKQHFASFYNTLQDACKKSRIGAMKTLSFSVGDVFAQNLCLFDDTDTKKVIDKLILKTHPIKGGILSFLNK